MPNEGGEQSALERGGGGYFPNPCHPPWAPVSAHPPSPWYAFPQTLTLTGRWGAPQFMTPLPKLKGNDAGWGRGLEVEGLSQLEEDGVWGGGDA